MSTAIEPLVPLALRQARRFAARFPKVDPLGLESAALGALMKAAESYDPGWGSQFSTWAYRCVRFALLEYARRQARCKSPVLRRLRRPLSLSERAGGGPCTVLQALPAPGPTPAETYETSSAVGRVLARLPPRSAALLRLTELEGLSQAEAGRRLGLGESRVSQLRAQALARLRKDYLVGRIEP